MIVSAQTGVLVNSTPESQLRFWGECYSPCEAVVHYLRLHEVIGREVGRYSTGKDRFWYSEGLLAQLYKQCPHSHTPGDEPLPAEGAAQLIYFEAMRRTDTTPELLQPPAPAQPAPPPPSQHTGAPADTPQVSPPCVASQTRVTSDARKRTFAGQRRSSTAGRGRW